MIDKLISIDASQLAIDGARELGLAQKKIKAALISAINDGARAGYEAGQKEMDRVFDRPTPWVKGGIRYTKARRGYSVAGLGQISDPVARLLASRDAADKLEATIDLDRWGNKHGVTVDDVLNAQISGGIRRHKRHEVALRAAGVLPPGMYIVPGPGARRDRFGNMDAAQTVQIISWFNGFERVSGARQNMTDKRRMQLMRGVKKAGVRQRGFELFAIKERSGKLPPGIYMRKDYSVGEHRRMSHLSHGGAVALMFFVRAPQYKQRYDFYAVSKRAAVAQMQRSLDMYLTNMLRERGL